jgi:hypothetical protein
VACDDAAHVEPRVLPQLSVRRGRAAIEFYAAALGAVEVYRVGGSDAHPDVVAQLAIGDASFRVSDESPEHGNFSRSRSAAARFACDRPPARAVAAARRPPVIYDSASSSCTPPAAPARFVTATPMQVSPSRSITGIAAASSARAAARIGAPSAVASASVCDRATRE